MRYLLFLIFSIKCFSIFGQINVDERSEETIAQGREAIFDQLIRAKNPKNYLDYFSLTYHSPIYYSDTSKQLLLEIIKDDWMTPDQKKELAHHRALSIIHERIKDYEEILRDTLKFKKFENRYRHFSHIKDSLENIVSINNSQDSTFQKLVSSEMIKLSQRRLSNTFIYAAAMQDDSLYMDVLKNALNDTLKYDQSAIMLALARFGLEPFKTDLLNEYRVDLEEINKMSLSDAILIEANEIFPVVAFLANQEMIMEYAKLLELEYFECIDEGDYQLCSISSSVIIGLYNIILNAEFRSFFKGVSPSVVSEKHLEWTKKWLRENYGSYDLNRKFYPGLP